MLLEVKDANGNNVNIIANGQATTPPTNLSGTIAQANTSQELAPANPTRSGFYFQNLSTDIMYVNDLGADAAVEGQSWLIQPAGTFPPCGYPVPVGAITISGPTVDAKFVAREW